MNNTFAITYSIEQEEYFDVLSKQYCRIANKNVPIKNFDIDEDDITLLLSYRDGGQEKGVIENKIKQVLTATKDNVSEVSLELDSMDRESITISIVFNDGIDPKQFEMISGEE